MSSFLFMASMALFIIGLIQLFSPENEQNQARPVKTGIPAQGTTRSSLVNRSLASQAATSQSMKLDWMEIGQRIATQHPIHGLTLAHVIGRVHYIELWQHSRGAQVPWTPTGNTFLGFLLEGGTYLLNWQNRFYLLEGRDELSDADIQRYFQPYARQFAQSDQTADVYFSYPPAMWHIDDIGKFRIGATEGEASLFRPGSVGRFIHASGDGGRALVVEDYESGGQDTAWNGYLLKEEDIQLA